MSPSGKRLLGRDCVLGLVLTMGAVHDDHGALLDDARRQCFVVIASIFVNPIQLDQKSVTISLQERSKMMSPISGSVLKGRRYAAEKSMIFGRGKPNCPDFLPHDCAHFL
jgi:hypothetical protein